MAKFLNKKEQVYDLKLTSYGHHLLSTGKFKPVYYAFYDDNVIYDIRYASGSASASIEPQNNIHERIKENTSYLEGQVLFSEVERNINKITELDFFETDITPTMITPAEDFNKELKRDLLSDLEMLKDLRKQWESIRRDPKLMEFIDILGAKKILKENKLIVFSESRETVEYLAKNLKVKFGDCILAFSGESSAVTRNSVIENFDAKVRNSKDDYRILITTEVLAEGVNLHRSNVVINYDIPWNPTRMMQRVGRINRVDTKFDKIFSFNFFPTQQSNDQIKLKEAAEAKIHAFISLLGADARLLVEGEEIESHELFDKLITKKTILGEDEEEESQL